MVRYKVKPEQAGWNEELVRAVYEELHQSAPAAMHYATFVLDDGVSFIHIASNENEGSQSPLMDISAFRRFQERIADRCDEPPTAFDLREVGSYAFWGEWDGRMKLAPDRPERTLTNLELLAAVQLLPPHQRATQSLRDVIGYTAAEVAAMLATSVAGINIALQRARATLEESRTAAQVAYVHARTSGPHEKILVQRLVNAWHASDVSSIVALLAEDALLTMPHLPIRFVGREEIAAFLATGPASGRLDKFRLVPTHANRQPALAAYERDGGTYLAYALIVLAIEGEAIASLTRFADVSLFEYFGLPMTFVG
jgi:SnoaL-like domain/Sigma-70, region 4